MKFIHLLTIAIMLIGGVTPRALYCQSKAQEAKHTLSGYIRDQSNGESLIGATIVNKDNSNQGAVSNIYGFYSLTLPKGEYNVTINYLGYVSQTIKIQLDKDLTKDIEMQSTEAILEEITIMATRADENINSTDVGKIDLGIEKIKSLPAFMGEVDLMKTIELLPGVQNAGEGTTGFYVRGGGPDQNLVLLDDAIVYNTGHLFGFFSVFNADAIKNVSLIKGGMPAAYGGRLSSVLDVSMNEGNNREWQVDGGIGLIASRLTIQGPIKKDKASFIVSGRRTYAFELATPYINKTDFKGTGYYFYDLNTKINYKISNKDRIYLSGYFGRDVFTFNVAERSTNLNIPWGNATTTLRWNHLFNDKLFMNVSAVYNDYKFKFKGAQDDFVFTVSSGIIDYNLKADWDYYPSPKHKIKFGGNYTFHTFIPNSSSGSAGDQEFPELAFKKYAHESAIYGQDEMDLTDWLRINIGLRFSMFNQVGPSTKIIGTGTIADTLSYNKGELIKTYFGPEPRMNARIKINSTSSIKTGVTYNQQYIHLVTNSGSTLPTDLWVPSSNIVAPQKGWQYSLGYFQNFKQDKYETSAEVFYKELKNQIEYSESYIPDLGKDIEDGFVFGKGKAYGLELFVKKSVGKFNGWVGYTLSKTDRTFPDLNDGKVFVPKYDRRHDLSVALNYKIAKKWDMGLIFVYATGNAITLPQSFFIIDDQVGQVFTPRNTYRIKPYHRADFSVTYTPTKKRKRFEQSFNLSIYNLYNRKNVYFIYTDSEIDFTNLSITNKAYEFSMFVLIPSLTWNFSF